MDSEPRDIADRTSVGKAITLLLFTALNVLLAVTHEPWRDEAQAWLMARDQSIGELIHSMGYEVTPGLWHLMLWPLAQLGAPYGAMAALHSVVMIIAAGLIVYFAPFRLWQKTAVVFSYYIFFEYGVIQRHYSLMVLFAFAAAAAYSRRGTDPFLFGLLLVGLANSSLQGAVLAAGFCGLMIWDWLVTRRFFRATAMVCIVGLGLGVGPALIQAWPNNDAMLSDGDYASRSENPGIQNSVTALRLAYFPMAGLPQTPTFVFAVAIVLLLLFDVRNRLGLLLMFGATLALWLFLFAVMSPGTHRHFGLIFVLSLVVLWIHRISPATPAKSGNQPSRGLQLGSMAFFVAAVLSIPKSLYNGWEDLIYPFSMAAMTAETIREIEPLPLVSQSPNTKSVLPYIPDRQVWRPYRAAFGTYDTHDELFPSHKSMSTEEQIRLSKKQFGANPFLFVSPLPLAQPASYGLTICAYVEGAHFVDENYYIYSYDPVSGSEPPAGCDSIAVAALPD